jgi:hypothetical protein
MAWEASVKEQELEHESADALYFQKNLSVSHETSRSLTVFERQKLGVIEGRSMEFGGVMSMTA